MDSPILITRASDVHSRPVAEFALALILAAAKHIPAFVAAQQRREWSPGALGQLRGACLVIVGFGAIGQALARLVAPFDMRVIGVRRSPRPDALAESVVGPDRLHEVLALADYAVLTAPATPETHHLIDAAALAALRPDAYLINVGRGSLVDEQALDAALRAGAFAGALLDTVETEPLPADDPLWTNPRVVITPHVAGLRYVPVNEDRVRPFVENLARFIRGEPLREVVDKRRGY